MISLLIAKKIVALKKKKNSRSHIAHEIGVSEWCVQTTLEAYQQEGFGVFDAAGESMSVADKFLRGAW